MARMAMALVAAAVAAVWATGARALVDVPELTLVPPYNDFSSDGERELKGWLTGGDTDVKENYFRLARDRQSKRGFAWSRRTLAGKMEWTLTLRFRVSGQGRDVFGDGLALWVTRDAYHMDGDLHGYRDTFEGFGIIMDTYRNREPGHVHKDVSVVWSDGTTPAVAGNADTPGCDANFRYYEKRDDFDPATARSALQLHYKYGELKVRIDPRNDGNWKTCVNNLKLPLRPEWTSDAHIGFTATTGALADNHDVLSVQVLDGNGAWDDVPAIDRLPNTAPVSPPITNEVKTGQPRVDNALESTADALASSTDEKLKALKASLEHKLHGVEDHLRVLIEKLEKAESAVESRLDEVEKRLEAKLSTTLDERVDSAVDKGVSNRISNTLDRHVRRSVEERVGQAVNRQVTRQMGPALNAKAKELEKTLETKFGGPRDNDPTTLPAAPPSTSIFGWIADFVILGLLVAVAGIGYATYKNARQLRKSHLP